MTDLPLAPARAPVSQHWSVRLRDALATYLPLLLMLALAGLTWWLVRVTPVPSAAFPDVSAPSTPDYVLRGLELRRYRADGRLLAQVSGAELRHYPIDDHIELDDARVQAEHPNGPLHAQARRAVVSQDAQHLRLQGDVELHRLPVEGQAGFTVKARSMELDNARGRAWSDEPVTFIQPGQTLEAAGFVYEDAQALLSLKGPVRARHEVAGRAAPPAAARR